jgi:DNA-binding SARP family transcriptional activator
MESDKPIVENRRIDILSGEIRPANPADRLTKLERCLLFFIGLKPEGVTREEIADELFPHLDLAAASNSLRVAICRARRKCGSPSIVECVNGRYILVENPHIDLRAAECAVRKAAGNDQLTGPEVSLVLGSYLARIRRHFNAPYRYAQWFEATVWRLEHLERRLCRLLAEDALRRGRPEEALAIVRDLNGRDPLDELPSEIAIRAHNALGDRGAAITEFSRYARRLEGELGVKPGHQLRDLALRGG